MKFTWLYTRWQAGTAVLLQNQGGNGDTEGYGTLEAWSSLLSPFLPSLVQVSRCAPKCTILGFLGE